MGTGKKIYTCGPIWGKKRGCLMQYFLSFPPHFNWSHCLFSGLDCNSQLAYASPFKHVLFSKVKYKKHHYLSGVPVGIPAVS